MEFACFGDSVDVFPPLYLMGRSKACFVFQSGIVDFGLVNRGVMNKFKTLSCRETFPLPAPQVSIATLILQVPPDHWW